MKARNESVPLGEAIIPADGEKLLSKLETILAEQVSLARTGQFDKVASLTTAAEELLAQAGALASSADQRQVDRCWDLYGQLCLALRAEQSELAARLKHLRKGKRSLRAYRDDSAYR